MTHAPGLYLHLPFGSAICPYCDFAVLTGDGERKRRFVESLIRETELVVEAGAEHRFDPHGRVPGPFPVPHPAAGPRRIDRSHL